MFKKLCIFIGLSSFLLGCDQQEVEIKKFSLRCGNYDVFIELSMKDDSLNTAINGEKIQMFRAISASGARYEGKGAVVSASVWNKGESWQLSLDKGGYIICKVLKR